MIKRISLLLAAALLVATMAVASAAPVFAAPATPHKQDQSGPSDAPTKPGTCVTETQQGANVTVTEKKGNCQNQGTQTEETGSFKRPPGKNK